MQIICVNSCFLCLFVCVSCAFLSHICIPSVSSIVFCSRSFCIFFSYTRLGVCVPAKTFFCGWGTQKHEWGAPRFLRNSIRHKNTLSAWLRQSAFSLHRTPYTIHLSPPLHGVKDFARLSVQWTVIEPYGWGLRYKTEGLPNHYRRITEG